MPSVSAVIAQRLAFEVMIWGVEKTSADSTPGLGAAMTTPLRRAMVSAIENLACWDYPSSDGIKLLSWEVIRTRRVIEPSAAHQIAGTGYRMQLEVERPGSLRFVPSGTCDLDGRVALVVEGGK